MCLQPKDSGGVSRINPNVAPPDGFIAAAMHLAVMPPAQRNRELVADLAAQGSRLGELQMMGIARNLPADEAGLLPDEQQMRLAALAGKLLGMGQPRFVRRGQRGL